MVNYLFHYVWRHTILLIKCTAPQNLLWVKETFDTLEMKRLLKTKSSLC